MPLGAWLVTAMLTVLLTGAQADSGLCVQTAAAWEAPEMLLPRDIMHGEAPEKSLLQVWGANTHGKGQAVNKDRALGMTNSSVLLLLFPCRAVRSVPGDNSLPPLKVSGVL